jgi:integrase
MKMRALHEPHVFLHGGQPILSIKGAFKASCKGAGITNFRFHDLRHTAITNMRRAVCLRLSRRGNALALHIEQRACHVTATLAEQDRSALGMLPKGRRV